MILTAHVRPSARQNSIEWIDEDTCKISVSAPPEKGKANKAVTSLLANELKVSKSSIELVRGATARIKQFKIN